MSEIKYTELDFAKIKENLKTYLKSQSKFRDYDFDASGLSILLDVLAYNTAYNGFYLNMLASESFLDSAYMRASVVSRAKQIGYTPSSRRSLSSVVDIHIDFSKNLGSSDASMQKLVVPGGPFLIPTTTEFYCLVNSSKHSFFPKSPVLAVPTGGTNYVASKVTLIEGKRLTFSWIVESNTKNFVIPNENVDLSTLQVYVSPYEASTQKVLYNEFKDINELTPTDQIYFIQESLDNKFEIIFGDGVLGKRLELGNVVQIEYVVPNSDAAIGADKFYLASDNLGTFSIDNTLKQVHKGFLKEIKTSIPARDYAEKESVESIKFKAPRIYSAQNRAVTKNDYEILLKKDMNTIDPKIDYIRVWGGEENTPPDYGKVFFAIKPSYGLRLNEQEKEHIIEKYIRPKNMVSVQAVIVEPDYIGLVVDSTVNYSGRMTKNNEAQIKNLVYQKIQKFRDENILGFDSDLRYSKFVSQIDSADPSIESNITKITLKYRINPEPFVNFTKHIPLTNAISRGDILNNTSSVSSTTFNFFNMKVFLGDDGRGNLVLYRKESTDRVALTEVGKINYDTGDLYITNLKIDSIENDLNYIDIFVTPKYQDVIAYKNQILLLENSDIKVSCVNLDYVRTS